MRYVALLRGINVGKAKRIAMADLRTMLEDLGFVDIQTYLQSGQAVLTSPAKMADTKMETLIHDAIGKTFGMDVAVLVRNGHEIREIVEKCPFDGADEHPKNAHVMFLDRKPSAAAIKKAATEYEGPDQYVLDNRTLYVWYENGQMGSSLTKAFWNAFDVTMTGRNWNTITKLNEIAN